MPSRSRSRSNMVATTTSNTEIRVGGGGTSYSVASQYTSGKSESMQDVVTPSFQKRRNQGDIVNSPMTRTVISASGAKLYSTSWNWVKKPGQPAWPNGEVTGFSCPDPIGLRFGRLTFPETSLPPWNDTLAGQAIASARSDAASASAQLLVSLGEARETLALLKAPLDVLLKRTEPFRVLRSRYNSGKLTYNDFIVEFSNIWLLYRYGIMPLVYEIQGIVKALTEPSKPQRSTSRAIARDSGSTNWKTTGSSSMITKIELAHSLVWTREYRATCLYESEDDLQARFGLRLADVPVAAWELTRLSFVYDWFVNAGDFLGSLTLSGRANVLMQCVVERLTAQYTALYSESGGSTSTSSVSTCINDGSGSEVNFVLLRTQRAPIATTAVGSLTPRLALTPKRILDGLSLLSTSFDISNRKTRLVKI